MSIGDFDTARLEEETHENEYRIGSFYENKGIYAGVMDNKHIFVALHNLSEKELMWDEAISLAKEKNLIIPDIRQLDLIWLNKDKINNGLKENGGDLLSDDWYWSSTEYSSNTAWVLYFDNGVRWHDCNFYNYYVRTILVL